MNSTATMDVDAYQIVIAGSMLAQLIVSKVSVRLKALLLALKEVTVHGINAAKLVRILALLIYYNVMVPAQGPQTQESERMIAVLHFNSADLEELL